MKIIALQAENLKRLTAVRIEPDGNLVQITGKNGQGKTSVLDAIWWALDGTKHVQAQPIRQGQETAIVHLDLGKIKVTRKFRAKDDGNYTTSIIVENEEGARFSSPQKMLDDFLGELTFDPLAFTRMRPDEQAGALQRLVPDFDFAAVEQSIKDKFEKRTTINRQAREAQAAATKITDTLPDEIPDFVDDDKRREIYDRQDKLNTEITIAAREAEHRTNLATQKASILDEITRLQNRAKAIDEKIDELGEPKNTDTLTAELKELREKMTSIDSQNKIAEQAKRRDELTAQATTLSTQSDKLTAEMDAQKTAMKNAIASAEMPVDGLSIEAGAVLLNGVPFDQASDAQQLQTSIAIAMALNPKLRVIRVRDGSLLDSDAMDTLAKMANERDYQIWIERVDSSGKIGFVMEDGHLKDAPQDEKKPTESQPSMFSEALK